MNQVAFRKTTIRPMDCLAEAQKLIGDQYWLFVGICAVAMIIGGAVPVVLIGPMMVGMFLCFLDRLHGKRTTFERLFKGFDYFMESLIAALIITAISFAVMLPIILLMVCGMFGGAAAAGQNGDAAGWVFMLSFGVLYLAIFLVQAAIYTLFLYVFPLMADRQVKGLDAVKLSYRAAMANLGGTLGLTLLNGLLIAVGSLCCYFPAFLVLPFCAGAVMIAYRKVFPEGPDEPLPGKPVQTPPPPPQTY